MRTKMWVPLLLVLCASAAVAAEQRHYEATYTATVANIPAGLKEIRVWIPLPATRGVQRVESVTIESPYQWTRMRDAEYGNDYAVATIQSPPPGDLVTRVRFRAARAEETIDSPAEKEATAAELQRALQPNKLVTISPRVKKLAEEITAGKKTTIEQAQAIYDYLVTNMKYDKTIPGWGHGDTERACDIKAGNCTDFHSLFISLARSRGIPARFIIGFPLTAKDGDVKGYHCWAEFYVKGKGWIPVDPSEGSKLADINARNYLFGHLDPERIQFTIGRDLVLKPKTVEPLNYFIYPHAEAAGKEVGTPAIGLKFQPVVTTGGLAGSVSAAR